MEEFHHCSRERWNVPGVSISGSVLTYYRFDDLKRSTVVEDFITVLGVDGMFPAIRATLLFCLLNDD